MKKFPLIVIFVIALQFGLDRAVSALDHFKLLDLQVGDQRVKGRVLTHNDEMCWLLHQDGRLQQIAMGNVTDFKELGERFKANSQLEIRKQLETEFGSDFEVRTTSHYVVVARRGIAESYAVLFERIYFEFMRLFRARGLRVVEAEFPLVAIVLPDEVSFVKYCRNEKTRVQPGMVGFYLSTSNRVAMYERPNAMNLDRTVIHEATHQVAFNTGIHSRLARHPRWVVEGLATVFEADGIRSRHGTSSPADRINRERYLWFLEYAKSRRPAKALKNFVCEDSLFEKSVLDAYGEAWSLSFFLMETQPKEYSNYLKKLVDRDPLSVYGADERLKDFTDSFGQDLDKIESTFLWFIQKIAKR
jgi:hypothetical protein